MRVKDAFALPVTGPAYAPFTSIGGNSGTQSIWPLPLRLATILTLTPVATIAPDDRGNAFTIKDLRSLLQIRPETEALRPPGGKRSKTV